MATKLNQHTYRKWRAEMPGCHIEQAEFFAQAPGGLPRKSDLFGFVDLIIIPRTELSWLWVQVTSWGNVATRLRKIREGQQKAGTQFEIAHAELARRILARGDRILIEGWKKESGRYISREHWVTREDLE